MPTKKTVERQVVEAVVTVRWHHGSSLGHCNLYEIAGRDPKHGVSVALSFEDLGFDVLHGSIFRVTVEQLAPGKEVPNPYHGKCASCGRQSAGHDRICCKKKGGGYRYICNDCWGEHGELHYALYHLKDYPERERVAFDYRHAHIPPLAESRKAAVALLRKLKAQRKERGF